jgi:hypothetical protein
MCGWPIVPCRKIRAGAIGSVTLDLTACNPMHPQLRPVRLSFRLGKETAATVRDKPGCPLGFAGRLALELAGQGGPRQDCRVRLIGPPIAICVPNILIEAPRQLGLSAHMDARVSGAQ